MTPLLNVAALDELRDMLGDELADLLAEFVAQLDELVAAVVAALSAGSANQLASAAHTLKGSAGNFAADRLSALAGAIEVAARANDLSTVAAYIESLQLAARDTVAELAARGYCAA